MPVALPLCKRFVLFSQCGHLCAHVPGTPFDFHCTEPLNVRVRGAAEIVLSSSSLRNEAVEAQRGAVTCVEAGLTLMPQTPCQALLSSVPQNEVIQEPQGPKGVYTLPSGQRRSDQLVR